MTQKTKTQKFRRLLLNWYRENKRHLPWRTTRNPYRILVSEIMLQQTQASRVQKKYPLFLKRYPTLQSLASSPVADVIRSWQGMGYNRRVLRLKRFAEEVVENYGGRIPREVKLLQSLPGVGQYTAHATACFAFDQPVPVVDVNVTRVLSRVFQQMNSVSERKNHRTVWKLAQRILPGKDVSHWNQALMDLGATVCTARRPLCATCLVNALCSSVHILSRSNGEAAGRSATREKLYRGLPVRIYRGRIVESLRRLNGRSTVELSKLGRLIKHDFTSTEIPWLKSVIQKLTEDGLVELGKRERKIHVRLPLT